MSHLRIAIIGGGAAGMMCAATLAEYSPEAEVFLIEKNDGLGKKVLISGGGRCNVTTGYQAIREVLAKYPRGDKFLTTAMYHFSPSDVYDWFELHGTALKCEDDMRVFPVSDNGRDVLGAFERVFEASRVKVLLKHIVKEIIKTDTGFQVVFKDGEPLLVDRVVLALGGQAYRHTGSTGDGYTLAEKLGHHITPLAASLSSFITQEKWVKPLSGISFEKALFTVETTKKYTFTGPFLFTHSGVSGPAVFALSSLVAFEKASPAEPLPFTIDFVPDESFEACEKKLKAFMLDNPKKTFKNSLHIFVPLALAEAMCQEIKVPLEQKNAETAKQTIQQALEHIKHLPLHCIGRGAGDEFVTAGGVETSEVDPQTMESTLCPGLFFAGEILNVDGFTGGFNLQASWATGRLAGEHAGLKV
jgi:predicted Rossmann fold flavoprotein